MQTEAQNSIKKNYAFNLAYQIVVMLSPLIVTPYISRVLQADGIGKYQYVNAIVSYFIMFVNSGTVMYGQREVAGNQTNKEKISNSFWHIHIIRTVSFVLASIAYLILLFVFYKTKYFSLIIIEYILIVAAYLDISWFFIGLEKFKLISIRSIAVKIISLFAVFIFVNSKTDLVIYALITALGYLFGSAVIWIYMPKIICRPKISRADLYIALRNSVIFFIPSIATTIYCHLDKVLLGTLSGDFETGYYAQGERVVKLLITIITALSTVLLPRITSLISSKQIDNARVIIIKVWKYILCIAIPMTIGLIVIAKDFVPFFFGQGYDQVIIIIILLAPLSIIIGSNSVMGYAVLIPNKSQKEYNTAAVFGCIINLLIDIILIPMFGAIGACIGTLVAELTVCIIEYVYTKRIMNILFPLKDFGVYTLCASIMGSFVFAINNVWGLEGWKIVFQLLIGGMIYILLLTICKDEIISMGKSFLNDKAKRCKRKQ